MNKPEKPVKESGYWRYIHQITKNTTPDEANVALWLLDVYNSNCLPTSSQGQLYCVNKGNIVVTTKRLCWRYEWHMNPGGGGQRMDMNCRSVMGWKLICLFSFSHYFRTYAHEFCTAQLIKINFQRVMKRMLDDFPSEDDQMSNTNLQ